MAELIAIDLTDEERSVLRAGLVEWGGPARVTQELAVGMGFRDQEDLFGQGNRIRMDLEAGRPLSPLDWARTVLATEIVFASNLVGSGRDWSVTPGSRTSTRCGFCESYSESYRAVWSRSSARSSGPSHQVNPSADVPP